MSLLKKWGHRKKFQDVLLPIQNISYYIYMCYMGLMGRKIIGNTKLASWKRNEESTFS